MHSASIGVMTSPFTRAGAHRRVGALTPHIARRTLAAAAATIALLAAAPSAWASLQWNDGQPATSTFTCVGEIIQGADVVAGYQADPASLPKAGDVFYGHVGFGAAVPTCDGATQYGEVDLVLPPGVSMAVDASHPITCTYTDINGPTVPNPTCPTNTDNRGIYGPALSPHGPGSAWQLPAGRWFEIQFPLRADRQLLGEAGGYCPLTVDQIGDTPNDCLGAVLGLADGDADNPWLLAHEGLVIDPAATPTPPTPTPTCCAPAPKPTPTPTCCTPGPTPTPRRARVVGRVAVTGAHLARLMHTPLTLRVRCVEACRGTVTIGVSATTAERLRLSRHSLTLARGHFAARAGNTATVHLKVSHRLAMKVRRLRSLPVTITTVPADGRQVVIHPTLKR